MAVATSSAKTKGPIVDPALCRCCRSIKKCRLLTAEYQWSGSKEIYSEMIMDCFGLLLCNLDGEGKDSCICATCVVRLRDACAFKRQVLRCEAAFLDTKLHPSDEAESKVAVEVKAEPAYTDSDTPMDDRDDPDYKAEEPVSKCEPVADKHTRMKTDMEQPRINTRGASKLKPKKVMKRHLLDKMQKLRVKLDRMLDKPEPAKKLKLAPQKKKKSELDHEDMVFNNAIIMAQCSYICPFHNRVSNYYCYYCKDQFTNPIELREHTLSHDPKELFESSMENKKIPKIDITKIDCRLCPEKINDLIELKKHLVNVHDKVMYPVTNEFLTFKLSLDSVTCTECNSSFPYFDMLKKHMIDHFGTYICDQCGACFLEQNSLRTHIKSHNKVEVNFPCEICGKNLKSKYSRYLHVATVHEKKPTVNCYKCEESFLSYALRNRHLIEVHGDKRTFPCKLCDKVYNRRKTLMEHNRRNHLKVYRHQCDLCDQRFYLPSRLKEHMATHTGERNFRCEYCEKSYPRLQSLQEHIRSHSNERRFKCEICNSAFTQNGSLKNHMKSHHQGFELESFS